jgi:cytochrome P450
MTTPTRPLSLTDLLAPDVLANPYPLYARLRQESPVLWDPFLHAWVVTRYDDVAEVLARFRAERTPTPERLTELGMQRLAPVAQIMVKQMLFMDPPQQRRVRGLASTAFTARRVERLRSHIRDIANDLIDRVVTHGEMDLISDFANPLPAIVTAEMLGVPTEDHQQLKDWTQMFAEVIGNFQLNPDGIDVVLDAVSNLTGYLREALGRHSDAAPVGLIGLMSHAQIHGDRLTEEELIANVIVTMVGGHETTTNLIGNGLLTLLGQPAALNQLRDDPAILPVAIEELLRYESPVQTTARIAPEDTVLCGQPIQRGEAVIAVIAAANRDPERFADPDRLDLTRRDNRHLAFGWGSHFCFGAPLARIESGIAFQALLTRLRELELVGGPLRRQWRANLGLRGLMTLPIRWRA